MIGYTDSTTPLGSAGTFQGVGRVLQSNSPFNFFNAAAFADQTGTLQIQQSLDGGASWQLVETSAVPANTFTQLSTKLTGSSQSSSGVTPAQYRVNFINGATVQGVLRLSSSLSEV